MFINGNDKVGEAKVYHSEREFKLEKELEKYKQENQKLKKQIFNLETKVKRKYYSGMPKEVRKDIEKLKAALKIYEDAPWVVRTLLHDQEVLFTSKSARNVAEEFLRRCDRLEGVSK